MTKLLVIEDNPKHLSDAKKLLKERVDSGAIQEVDYATSLEESYNLLSSKKYDGIISDVFFPEKEGGSEQESGTKIGQYALDHKIPFVLVTSTHHHGKKAQPVCEWMRNKGMNLVDSDIEDREGEAPTKPWKGGYAALAYLMEGIKEGELSISSKGIKPKKYDSVDFMVFVMERRERGDLNPDDPIYKNSLKKYCTGMKIFEDERNREGGGLEKTLTSIIAISGLGAGIFFLSSNITGNAIANLSTKTTSFLGAGLLIIGLVAGFFWLKSRKK